MERNAAFEAPLLHELAVVHFIVDAERLLRFAILPMLFGDQALGFRKTSRAAG